MADNGLDVAYAPYTPAAALTLTRRRKAGVLFISAALSSFTYGVEACLAQKSAGSRSLLNRSAVAAEGGFTPGTRRLLGGRDSAGLPKAVSQPLTRGGRALAR